MRICIVTQFFAPDITAAAFRLTETAVLLAQRGHDLRVITSHPHKAIASDESAVETFDESKVLRTHLRDVGPGGLKGYVLHYLSFVVGALRCGWQLRRSGWRPDVIWATSPPLFAGIAGVVLAWLFRRPIVLDIRDIWPDSAVSAGQMSASGRAYHIGRILEKNLYTAARAITCVSKPMAEYLRSQSSTPVEVIYNGIDPNQQIKVSPEKIVKRIVYAGNLGRLQGLEMLIGAFQKTLHDPLFEGWEIALIGAGAHEQMLRKRVADLQLDARIHFIAPVSKIAATRYLAESAVLFLNLKADAVFALTIPSKVFDYMLVSRPILGGIVGEGKEILESTGGNLCFTPSDEQSFSMALHTIVSNLAHYEARAASNAERVCRDFRREIQVQNLENLLKDSSATTKRKSH